MTALIVLCFILLISTVLFAFVWFYSPSLFWVASLALITHFYYPYFFYNCCFVLQRHRIAIKLIYTMILDCSHFRWRLFVNKHGDQWMTRMNHLWCEITSTMSFDSMPVTHYKNSLAAYKPSLVNMRFAILPEKINTMSQFCVCHNRWALVTCANLWRYWIVQVIIIAKTFTTFTLWPHQCFVNWIPGHCR